MSAARKKGSELPTWPNANLPVWQTRGREGRELTVINLRDPKEKLVSAPEKPSFAPAEAASNPPRATVAPAVAAAPIAVGKSGPAANLSAQQQLKAALASAAAGAGGTHNSDMRITLGNMASLSLAPNAVVRMAGPQDATRGKASQGYSFEAERGHATTHARLPPSARPESWSSHEGHESAAPARRTPSPEPATAAFEFIAGTKIPGRAIVHSAGEDKSDDKSPDLALFHDPLWGGGPSAWGPAARSATVTSAPVSAAAGTAGRPPLEIFGTVSAMQAARPVAPPLQHQQQPQMSMQPGLHAGAPVLGSGSFMAQHGTMGPAPGVFPGGMTLAPAGMQGYPIMGVPVSYMQPQPQAAMFPAGMAPYGMAGFYSLGGMPPGMAMQPAPTFFNQGLSMTSTAPLGIISPIPSFTGTNVGAKPFVPGGAP